MLTHDGRRTTHDRRAQMSLKYFYRKTFPTSKKVTMCCNGSRMNLTFKSYLNISYSSLCSNVSIIGWNNYLVELWKYRKNFMIRELKDEDKRTFPTFSADSNLYESNTFMWNWCIIEILIIIAMYTTIRCSLPILIKIRVSK